MIIGEEYFCESSLLETAFLDWIINLDILTFVTNVPKQPLLVPTTLSRQVCGQRTYFLQILQTSCFYSNTVHKNNFTTHGKTQVNPL